MLGFRLVNFVSWLLDLYMWIIIAAALVSWVSPNPYNPIVQFLRRVTEPVLEPIRRLLGRYQTGIDFSPLVVILIIQFVQRVILPLLF
jgi:YggT family protein